MRPRSPASRPARWVMAGLVVRIAWTLERLSRRFVPGAPKAPPERLQFAHLARALRLEQPVYAAKRPPQAYVFIPEDEYFQQAEALLAGVTRR